MYTAYRAVERELACPRNCVQGSTGQGVRRLQEWLGLSGFATTVDGDYGAATAHQLAEYCVRQGLANKVNDATWTALTAPLARAFAPAAATGNPVAAALKTARQHLREHPREIGGANRGPWVRAYMDGNEGARWLWCAGFVTAVLAQAYDAFGLKSPLIRTYSCDSLAMDADAKGRLVRGRALGSGQHGWEELSPCTIFLVVHARHDWTHTGFGFDSNGTTYSTIEGNSNDSGSREGFEVARRVRAVEAKDFIRLQA